MKQTVLVVDDEPLIRALIAEAMESAGFEARQFKDGEEALASVMAEPPWCIVSDFKMPGMSGLELCAAVKKVYPDIPFLLVTAYADKEVALAGLGVGLADIVEKPFNTTQLVEKVAALVERKKAHLEAERREIEEITEIFIEESTDLLSDLDQLILRLECQPLDPVVVDALFRKVHSVKGGAAAVPGGSILSSLAHDFESALSGVKKGTIRPTPDCINLFLDCFDLCVVLLKLLKEKQEPKEEIRCRVERETQLLQALRSGRTVSSLGTAAQTSAHDDALGEEGVWVSNDKLDSFMSLSGELIVLKNYFQMLNSDPEIRRNPVKLEKKLAEFSYSLNKCTDRLQEEIMSVRKVTLDKVFSKLPRIVRQTGQEVGKRIRLNMIGLELGVDKNIAKALSTCLTHLVRNSADHGIERPEDRRAGGKSPEGIIGIQASESQGMVQIVVSDDGAGLNVKKIAEKALQQGVVDETRLEVMKPSEIQELIFLPGFSTAEKVSSISGRGVGMDVVKSAVQGLNGRVRIDSEPGRGTTFTLEIPVPKTVMVEQSVLSRSGDTTFAIPLAAILRISSCDLLVLTELDQMRMCQIDGRTVRLCTYAELVSGADELIETDVRLKTAIFLRHKDHLLALLVDTIEDQFEAVIRPFDALVKSLPGFAGTAVLGNESVAYLVSPEEMMKIREGKAA